jgi:acylpyruvate hydrolase
MAPCVRTGTSDMIFDVATLVSYISDAFTLEPGDLILTGTPAGVAMGRHPAPWLQPGQLYEVEIPAIGSIANRIVAEEPARV